MRSHISSRAVTSDTSRRSFNRAPRAIELDRWIDRIYVHELPVSRLSSSPYQLGSPRLAQRVHGEGESSAFAGCGEICRRRPVRPREAELKLIEACHIVTAPGLPQTATIRMSTAGRSSHPRTSANTSSQANVLILQEAGGTGRPKLVARPATYEVLSSMKRP